MEFQDRQGGGEESTEAERAQYVAIGGEFVTEAIVDVIAAEDGIDVESNCVTVFTTVIELDDDGEIVSSDIQPTDRLSAGWSAVRGLHFSGMAVDSWAELNIILSASEIESELPDWILNALEKNLLREGSEIAQCEISEQSGLQITLNQDLMPA